ncbi:MAG TPA: cytochrome P450 [Blastococcus sp.]|jgi:cytochrome P450 monooxygenase
MTTQEQTELMASDLPAEQRVCPHLRQATQDEPVRRIRTPAGDEAWLVSRHAEVRELMRDGRLGRSHPSPNERAQYCGDPAFDSVITDDHEAADMMHRQWRKIIPPQFGARRLRTMQPRIDQFVDEGIDALLAQGPPANLRTAFTQPLARRVIGELLGVPDAEQDEAAEFMRRGSAGDIGGLFGYLNRLVAGKRENPDDSLASAILDGPITDTQAVSLLLVVQIGGLGPIAKKVDYLLLLLAEQPEEKAAITADPSLIPAAVEELLRLAGNVSLPRYARQDIEIGGVTIREDDLVLLDMTRANYDGLAFDEPTKMDITRSPNRHMTFGHGAWSCAGAPLARKVLATLFEALLTRMPDLRPVEPISGVSGPLSEGLPPEVHFTW